MEYAREDKCFYFNKAFFFVQVGVNDRDRIIAAKFLSLQLTLDQLCYNRINNNGLFNKSFLYICFLRTTMTVRTTSSLKKNENLGLLCQHIEHSFQFLERINDN